MTLPNLQTLNHNCQYCKGSSARNNTPYRICLQHILHALIFHIHYSNRLDSICSGSPYATKYGITARHSAPPISPCPTVLAICKRSNAKQNFANPEQRCLDSLYLKFENYNEYQRHDEELITEVDS